MIIDQIQQKLDELVRVAREQALTRTATVAKIKRVHEQLDRLDKAGRLLVKESVAQPLTRSLDDAAANLPGIGDRSRMAARHKRWLRWTQLLYLPFHPAHLLLKLAIAVGLAYGMAKLVAGSTAGLLPLATAILLFLTLDWLLAKPLSRLFWDRVSLQCIVLHVDFHLCVNRLQELHNDE